MKQKFTLFFEKLESIKWYNKEKIIPNLTMQE